MRCSFLILIALSEGVLLSSRACISVCIVITSNQVFVPRYLHLCCRMLLKLSCLSHGLTADVLLRHNGDVTLCSALLQYKSSPCKKVCVIGWMVILPDDPARPNIFQLNDPDKGQPHTATLLPLCL